jgi:putative DNA primase/helicase
MLTVTSGVHELRIPDDLREWDQWVLWRSETRGAQRTKVPYDIAGKMASITSPAAWAPFEAALAAWNQYPKSYSGVGFVFTPVDPFCGIDLDDCIGDDGQVKEWARSTIEQFSDSYMEVSPSGKGIKIWARAALKDLPGLQVRAKGGGAEIYTHGRFFTVTGQAFRGAPLEVSEHTADVKELYDKLRAKLRTRGPWPTRPSSEGRILEGQRNKFLTSVAGTLARRRVDPRAIEVCLVTINEHQCERAIGNEEIKKILNQAQKWARRR